MIKLDNAHAPRHVEANTCFSIKTIRQIGITSTRLRFHTAWKDSLCPFFVYIHSNKARAKRKTFLAAMIVMSNLLRF